MIQYIGRIRILRLESVILTMEANLEIYQPRILFLRARKLRPREVVLYRQELLHKSMCMYHLYCLNLYKEYHMNRHRY